MIIREYEGGDLGELMRIHEAGGLPANCFPDLVIKDRTTGRLVPNPLFLVKEIAIENGVPAVAGFVRLTSEAYIVVNHEVGTPEQRFDWLKELTDHCAKLAWARGLDEMSCWIPPDILDSFEKRLKDLGFVRSPWVSFTKKLT